MNLPQSYFPYRKGYLHVEGTSVEELVRQYGTPLYVYSQSAIEAAYRELQKAFPENENLQICYAVKANSNLSLLRVLRDLGAGFDLVSGGELYRVAKAGGDSAKIVFSGVGKTREEIQEALHYQEGKGILSFQVESLHELMCLEAQATTAKKKASFCLRFNPGVEAETHPLITTGTETSKFGLTEKEILHWVKNNASKEYLHFLGVSVHIGSQIHQLKPFQKTFQKTQTLIQKLEAILKRPLEVVDVGGGIGIPYEKEKPLSLKSYAKEVSRYFGQRSPFRGRLKILLEPGRLLVGNAGVLVTQVLYEKRILKRRCLILDAGMNDLMRPALYEAIHAILPVHKRLGASEKTLVVGPVCESSDVFAKKAVLPKNLKEGDLVALLSAGAYGFSMANHYNSRRLPAEVLVHQDKAVLIRKRDRHEDLIRNEIL